MSQEDVPVLIYQELVGTATIDDEGAITFTLKGSLVGKQLLEDFERGRCDALYLIPRVALAMPPVQRKPSAEETTSHTDGT